MHATTPRKIPVSERALLARIRRKLGPQGRTVRSARGAGEHLGPYVELDTTSGRIVRDRLALADVEALGRELGVVQSWEEVQS